MSFTDLPLTPIFTLGLETPPSWLALPRASVHDLDNLRLADVSLPEGVRPEFELTSLVVDGHAGEEASQGLPRGAQLQLVDDKGVSLADTLVMANLGYFQLSVRLLQPRPSCCL